MTIETLNAVDAAVVDPRQCLCQRAPAHRLDAELAHMMPIRRVGWAEKNDHLDGPPLIVPHRWRDAVPAGDAHR